MYAGPLPDIAVTIFKSSSFFTHKISPTELKISETVFFEFVMSLTALPNNPVMPGVIILEALAQASGILGFKTMNKTPEEGSIYVFAGVDKVRFRKRVGPEDVIHLYSEVINEKKGIWKFETRAEVDGDLVCTATILCADRKA